MDRLEKIAISVFNYLMAAKDCFQFGYIISIVVNKIACLYFLTTRDIEAARHNLKEKEIKGFPPEFVKATLKMAAIPGYNLLVALGLLVDGKKVISEKFDGFKEEKNKFLLDTTRKRTEYFFSNYESLDSKPYEQKQMGQEEIKPMVRERKK